MSSGSRWVTMVLFDQLLMLYKIHQSPQTTDPAGSHLNRLFKSYKMLLSFFYVFLFVDFSFIWGLTELQFPRVSLLSDIAENNRVGGKF